MIITLQLKLDLSKNIERKLKELENQKNDLTKKEYKKIKKQILKEMRKKLKQINKQYPFEKEIQKILDEDEHE